MISRYTSEYLSLIIQCFIQQNDIILLQTIQMEAESDPYFVIFEKRRLKAQEMHKTRREELFNRSRQMCFQQNIKQEAEVPSKEQPQDQGESSLNLQSNEENFFSIEQNQVKIGVQTMAISPLQGKQIEQQQNIINKAQKNFHQNKNKQNYKKTGHSSNYSKKYSKLIQIPSWMNVLPQQFNKFYGMARPDGRSALLIFDEGWIYAYDKFGKKINLRTDNNVVKQQFDQNLVKKLSQHLNGTILEIVLNQQSKTIFLIDLISWKHTIMTTQTFEFRYAWLISNAPTQLLNQNPFNTRIKLVEYLPLSDNESLKTLYLNNFGYDKEGLLFIHKQSPYIHGVNQNVMIWKDFNTSKYPIDQQAKQSNTQQKNQMAQNKNAQKKSYIYGVGKLAKNGNIYSQDGYKLGHINPIQIVGVPQGFIRFRVTGIQFKNSDRMQQDNQHHMQIESENRSMNMTLKNFEVVQYRKYGRIRADPLSRIIFQHRIRYDPLTIEFIASKLGISQ